ncbi:MAG: radical SAM protein [Terriglobia bacterium]|jgi:MoaA/NifB/PqqE/SkfB family radical SAM enzyme|nr:radical SAM protein [Terriglobia bacterium]
MKKTEVFRAWGRILSGRRPSLSIELTRECPLRCPGCYAYGDDHLGEGAPNLRTLSDFKGEELVARVLRVVKEHKPLHLSIVGGDPLVRYRELEVLLPELSRRGVQVQIVTSAFRTIPTEWGKIPGLCIVISVDGLAPEHDLRRRPATYERILKSIEGHQNMISVHCTITAQMLVRAGYLDDFVDFWSARPEIKRIWFSVYTPQRGEVAPEIVSREQRVEIVHRLLAVAQRDTKLDMHPTAIRALASPPSSPRECTFARTTTTLSADLRTRVTPCQFGGDPDCSQCGCMASAGLHALAEHRLMSMLRVGDLFDLSFKLGNTICGHKEIPQVSRAVRKSKELVTLPPSSGAR